MKRRSSIRIALLAGLCSWGAARDARAELGPESAHRAELEAHRHVEPIAKPRWIAGGTPGAPRVNKVVYGYYPYWVTQWERIRWDLLTHIAYFAIEMNSDGSLGLLHGWPDQGFVETAHMFGVRVDLAFTLFSGSGVASLCGNATNRARGIDNMIDQMELGDADGINIDFESLSSGTRDCLTAYVGELRATMTVRGHADKQISMAGAAVDYGENFDLGALSELIDVYFVMGYGYHWGGSGKAGPNGQLRVTSSWRPHISISMQRSIAHYTSLVPAEKRSVIVWGVPYYGNEWPTASETMHATTRGDGSARTYAVTRRAMANGRTRRYDSESENAWYAYADANGWRQCWFDDEESLSAKYDLVLEQEIGGVGMWALGYDESYPELWSLLDAYFTEAPAALEGTRGAPKPIARFPFHEANDTRLAPSNFFNYYGCAATTPEYGREWVYRFELCEPGTIRARVSDGAGVDVDVHLLSAAREDACLARDDLALEVELAPGEYFLTADAYVSNQVPQDGAFELDVEFEPAPDSPGCREPFVGVAGMPVRPPPARAVHLPRDPLLEQPDSNEPERLPGAPPAEGDDSCGCATTHAGKKRGLGAWSLLLALAGAALRRSRISPSIG